jgi:hypothetical protein
MPVPRSDHRQAEVEGFDRKEEAEAFPAQRSADRKAGRRAVKAARLAPSGTVGRGPRRPPSSLQAWTFGHVLVDWQDRHCDSLQDSTMRDYGPALRGLRRALGEVRARSLTDEHFEA